MMKQTILIMTLLTALAPAVFSNRLSLLPIQSAMSAFGKILLVTHIVIGSLAVIVGLPVNLT